MITRYSLPDIEPYPYECLEIGRGGELYGTAFDDGPVDTVYELTPPLSPGGSWTENVLYSPANWELARRS